MSSAQRVFARALIVCLLVFPGLANRAGAGNASVEDYIHSFESSYRNVRTLRADFTQTYVMDGRNRTESGTVYFERGGRMRWDYQQPQQKLFISDGKHLVLFVPEQRQLTRSSVKSSEDFRVPFRLLLSRLNLRKVFSRFEFAEDALKHDSTVRVIRAYPKKEYAQDYQEVLLALSPEFDIQQLQIVYADHTRMEFKFDDIQRNAPLRESLFQFTPPPGVEVIDQR
jgi:outer membrane lipoprotein carrier protein